jgi:hypothetical protein
MTLDSPPGRLGPYGIAVIGLVGQWEVTLTPVVFQRIGLVASGNQVAGQA